MRTFKQSSVMVKQKSFLTNLIDELAYSTVAALLASTLVHFTPLVSLCTPWKHKKLRFKGVQKETSGTKFFKSFCNSVSGGKTLPLFPKLKWGVEGKMSNSSQNRFHMRTFLVKVLAFGKNLCLKFTNLCSYHC